MRRLLLCLCLICSNITAQEVVNDVSGLNPVAVARVVVPRSEQDVIDALRSHVGPVSIGGGRYSMGGQTAADGALQLDMRGLDQVLAFSAERREIRVQSGITWRAILEYIDQYDLSPQVMQSYANFTVGGSLSVNVHGRYVGEGAIAGSVKAIRVVLADGHVVDATPSKNAALFHGVIGGYGGLGVIVEATLGLVENTRIARESQVMALQDYQPWFYREIASQPDLVMHNGILYPDDFSTVRAVSYRRTEAALTEPDRLSPRQQGSHLQRAGIRLSSSPSGIKLREAALDPLLFRSPKVQWRNHEASLDVSELEPISGTNFSYVLQEYFVPPAQLERFIGELARLTHKHQATLINVSIRHAKADTDTLLSWAPEEVFALVLYYRQGTSDTDRQRAAAWTQELIAAALRCGGRHYLPYQIHASREQFLQAYPKAPQYFALKRELDPTYRFRNRLWDAYYRP
ncbi:putative FAD-linked oxidoreductase YitY [Pseudomonas straminea]|uniref:FAD/FMN-containing dehydrogenase n=1 Tax=Pseudomonas straminea TaxID=47882 RepID=A0A1I1W367_PSEOC|nr:MULTISPECIES: FAD-binding oxidoreductase [Pseudomonas]TWE06932.1 FAD/FMN-containing dehydrogenase [Pseudomonas sp. AG1028]GLX14558.1 putative FAD-linked oxidoreductase YitY [Pseudomonas straminea]SFD89574.1 FAD/FMN-containing dehydrogenase [Pseudomonas straminea]